MNHFPKTCVRGEEERHAEALARLEQMRVIDDELMRRVFHENRPLAERVLRVVTGIGDLVLTEFDTQHDLKAPGGSRSLVLDAKGVGENGTHYDLEVQTGDDPYPKRLRYHSALMDVQALKAGKKFGELPEQWVVFVMEEDPFGLGVGTYLFERCLKEGGMPLDDGTHLLYTNGSYRGDDELGRLMADFLEPNPEKINDRLMRDRVRYLKRAERGVTEMSRIMEEMCEIERERERDRTMLDNLRSIMESFKVGREDALAALKVPEADWPRYLALLGE